LRQLRALRVQPLLDLGSICGDLLAMFIDLRALALHGFERLPFVGKRKIGRAQVRGKRVALLQVLRDPRGQFRDACPQDRLLLTGLGGTGACVAGTRKTCAEQAQKRAQQWEKT
jgi:hypothetical protein